MSYFRAVLLFPMLILAGCWGRDDHPTASTPLAQEPVHQAPPALTVETRRALIAQRLAKRPLSDPLRNRVVEAWVAGSEGFDQAGMDRLLAAIDNSIAAVDENRFNASKDLAEGHTAAAGSTILGALVNGLIAETGRRQPITIDCGGIRASGWVERSSVRTNRAAVIITNLSVQEVTGRNVTYHTNDGLAYVMGPDGLEGLTLQSVTDERNNSWLGLRGGTLVTLVLIRAVDQSLLTKPFAAPTFVEEKTPSTAAPTPAPATPVVPAAEPTATVPNNAPAPAPALLTTENLSPAAMPSAPTPAPDATAKP